MTAIVVFLEVDDVDRWLQSPRRLEAFGPLGITGKLFADPAKSNRVGVYAEVPDMEAFQRAMQSATVAGYMQQDGVHVETLQVLVEAADHL
jgi:hypothetical protein